MEIDWLIVVISEQLSSLIRSTPPSKAANEITAENGVRHIEREAHALIVIDFYNVITSVYNLSYLIYTCNAITTLVGA